eukprot:sb/3475817/
MGDSMTGQTVLSTDAMQVYPIRGAPFCTTKIQEKLLKKLGTEKAFPFTFELPAGIPSSVTLQPVKNDQSSKPCGVEYCLRTYVAKDMHETPNRKALGSFSAHHNLEDLPSRYRTPLVWTELL